MFSLHSILQMATMCRRSSYQHNPFGVSFSTHLYTGCCVYPLGDVYLPIPFTLVHMGCNRSIYSTWYQMGCCAFLGVSLVPAVSLMPVVSLVFIVSCVPVVTEVAVVTEVPAVFLVLQIPRMLQSLQTP